jgi:hypothetical protein
MRKIRTDARGMRKGKLYCTRSLFRIVLFGIENSVEQDQIMQEDLIKREREISCLRRGSSRSSDTKGPPLNSRKCAASG